MKIDGEITLPGDKSISHRSLIFGALTSGTSKLFNLSDGEDVKSTISCLKDCNVKIVEKKNYTTVNMAKNFLSPIQLDTAEIQEQLQGFLLDF